MSEVPNESRIPSEVKMCFGGGCAPLFLLTREQKKNEHQNDLQKKEDFLNEMGVKSSQIFILITSTKRSHTHT